MTDPNPNYFVELEREDGKFYYVNPLHVDVVTIDANDRTSVAMTNGLVMITTYSVPLVMNLLRRAGHPYIAHGGDPT